MNPGRFFRDVAGAGCSGEFAGIDSLYVFTLGAGCEKSYH